MLKIDMTEPATDLPVLATLLKSDDPAVQAAALAKLGRFGPAVLKEMLPTVTTCLKSPDPAVQLEALKLVAAVGPDAVGAAPRAAELMARHAGPGAAPAGPGLTADGLTGEQVADRLMRSAAWIMVERYGRLVGSGSRDPGRRAPGRLVLTNFHVAAAGDAYTICFPFREGGGEVKTARPAFYTTNLPRLRAAGYATTGRVVAAYPGSDLALLKFDTLTRRPGSSPCPWPANPPGRGRTCTRSARRRG